MEKFIFSTRNCRYIEDLELTFDDILIIVDIIKTNFNGEYTAEIYKENYLQLGIDCKWNKKIYCKTSDGEICFELGWFEIRHDDPAEIQNIYNLLNT